MTDPTTTETGELVDLLATAIVRTGLGPTEVDAALDALSTLRSRIEELDRGARENHEAWGEKWRIERKVHQATADEYKRTLARIEELERERDAAEEVALAATKAGAGFARSLQEARGLLERWLLAYDGGDPAPVHDSRTFLSSTKETE